DYVFIDENGKPYSRSGVTFRIIRSGKRNILKTPAASVQLMVNPIRLIAGTKKLTIDNSSKVVNTSAVEYREKWKTDNNSIGRYYNSGSSCTGPSEQLTCTGYLDKSINPYLKGFLGNHRAFRSLVFYGDRTETDPAIATNLSQN